MKYGSLRVSHVWRWQAIPVRMTQRKELTHQMALTRVPEIFRITKYICAELYNVVFHRTDGFRCKYQAVIELTTGMKSRKAWIIYEPLLITSFRYSSVNRGIQSNYSSFYLKRLYAKFRRFAFIRKKQLVIPLGWIATWRQSIQPSTANIGRWVTPHNHHCQW